MATQLGAVLHLRLLGVPDAQGAVGRTGCDQVTGRIPGDGADPRETNEGIRG